MVNKYLQAQNLLAWYHSYHIELYGRTPQFHIHKRSIVDNVS